MCLHLCYFACAKITDFSSYRFIVRGMLALLDVYNDKTKVVENRNAQTRNMETIAK